MTELPKITLPHNIQTIIEDHCFSETSVEVGGFLVGTILNGETKVKVALPSLKAVSGQTNLTITHEAWNDALNTVDADYPDMRIVGWYHSHPGFGLFLSDYDQFIQENFFPDPGHVALVVDPLAGSLGWFVVRDGKTVSVSETSTKTKALARKGEERVDVEERINESQIKRTGVSAWKAIPVAMLLAIIAGVSAWTYGANQATDQANVARRIDFENWAKEKVALETAGSPSPLPTQIAGVYPYTVKKGDNLWDIALSLLGNGELYREIQRANPSIVGDTLNEGTIVNVPITINIGVSKEGDPKGEVEVAE